MDPTTWQEDCIAKGRALVVGQRVAYRGQRSARGTVVDNDGMTVRIQYSGGIAPWSVLDAGMDVIPVAD